MTSGRNSTSEMVDEAVIENAKWVNRVLSAGLSISGVVLLLRLLGAKEFKWAGIQLSTSYAWLVLFILSIAHTYTAYLLVTASHELWLSSEPERCRATFGSLAKTGGLFFRGLIPRRLDRVKKSLVFQIYRMRGDDPTTWISCSAAILAFIAMVPFDLSNLTHFIDRFVLAVIIVGFNWCVGTTWVIALSELKAEPKEGIYHKRFEHKSTFLWHGLFLGGVSEPPFWVFAAIIFMPLGLVLLIGALLFEFVYEGVWGSGISLLTPLRAIALFSRTVLAAIIAFCVLTFVAESLERFTELGKIGKMLVLWLLSALLVLGYLLWILGSWSAIVAVIKSIVRWFT